MNAKTKHLPIDQIEEEIIEEFSMLEDWMEKYEHLIDMGKSLPTIEDDYKTEDFRVRGCQSNVWLRAYEEDGKIWYKADSDAIITKGLIALMIRVLSGQQPEEIKNAKLKFLDKIGMKEHLSPTRSNGLDAMIRYMKSYAGKH